MLKFRLLKAVGGLIIVGVMMIGYLTMDTEPDEQARFRAEATEVDATVRYYINEGDYADANGWLMTTQHVLWGCDPAAAQGMIDLLFEEGAVNVWITDIELIDGRAYSASMAVELPDDPQARKMLLETEARYWDTEPNPDIGQRYIQFYFE